MNVRGKKLGLKRCEKEERPGMVKSMSYADGEYSGNPFPCLAS